MSANTSVQIPVPSLSSLRGPRYFCFTQFPGVLHHPPRSQTDLRVRLEKYIHSSVWSSPSHRALGHEILLVVLTFIVSSGEASSCRTSTWETIASVGSVVEGRIFQTRSLLIFPLEEFVLTSYIESFYYFYRYTCYQRMACKMTKTILLQGHGQHLPNPWMGSAAGWHTWLREVRSQEEIVSGGKAAGTTTPS